MKYIYIEYFFRIFKSKVFWNHDILPYLMFHTLHKNVKRNIIILYEILLDTVMKYCHITLHVKWTIHLLMAIKTCTISHKFR